MIVSPIKSVIKNLTDTQVVIQVTRTRKIYVAPCGQERDTVTIAGDIFSQFDYSKNAERLAERVMNGVVTVGYIIENPYTVEKTTVRSVLLSADLIEGYESWLGVPPQEDGNEEEEEEVEIGEAETSNEPAEDKTEDKAEDKTEDKAPEDNAATAEATEEQQTAEDQDSEIANQDAEETQEAEIPEVPEITEEKKEDTADTDAPEAEEPVSKKRTTRKLKVQ